MSSDTLNKIVKDLSKLSVKEDDEESMLDQAFNLKVNSRLGCQIEFNDGLDGIKVELAPE